MSDRDSNTWLSKVKRAVTSLLPVDKSGAGDCFQCGAYCKLPAPCIFYNEKAEKRCRIYPIRPPNCTKYPRTRGEQIVFPCGYSFPEGNAAAVER